MKYTLHDFLILKKSITPGTTVHIVSESMEPWIKKGESVTINPVQPENLKPFDIIVYWNKDLEKMICHIFLEIKDGMLITKPIEKKIIDSPNSIDFLLGVVTKPKFGFIQKMILKYFS